MESETFRAGQYQGVPLQNVPKTYLQWAYVNLEAMSPRVRMIAGVLLANWLGHINVPNGGMMMTAVKAQNKPVIVAQPDTAELLMQTLEYYASCPDGERARAMLRRLYNRKGDK